MSRCSRCGAQFSCAMADADAAEPCWCTRFPVLPPSALDRDDRGALQSCLCPDCLKAKVDSLAAGR